MNKQKQVHAAHGEFTVPRPNNDLHPVSVFAARHGENPNAYSFYAGEPKLY